MTKKNLIIKLMIQPFGIIAITSGLHIHFDQWEFYAVIIGFMIIISTIQFQIEYPKGGS